MAIGEFKFTREQVWQIIRDIDKMEEVSNKENKDIPIDYEKWLRELVIRKFEELGIKPTEEQILEDMNFIKKVQERK